MSARDELDRWQALADGATEGPWECRGGDRLRAPFVEMPNGDRVVLSIDPHNGAEDHTFIAAARTIVPAATKALRDVLDLHRESHVNPGWCRACDSVLPCATARAIEAAIGGEGRG